MKFKIEYTGWGVIYKPAFVSTIRGAVETARKKGWRDMHDSTDLRPFSANIYQRVDERWELVATVSPKGIETVDCQDRFSVRKADSDISKARSVIASASDVMAKFNAIADKEYAKSQSK